jgi:hypothetical protein
MTSALYAIVPSGAVIFASNAVLKLPSSAASGYPTATVHFKRVAVRDAHLVEGPAAVGSRYGAIAASEG